MLYPPTRYNSFGLKYLEYYAKHQTYHPGVDLNWGIGNQDLGQPVVACTWGIVVYVSPEGYNGGLGNFIVIHHPHNWAYVRCMHMDTIKVKAGETVYPNQIIGTVGKKGTNSAHLHFEVMGGVDWINGGFRPYGRYTSGMRKSEVAKLFTDPIRWIKTQEHYVGSNVQTKINETKSAIDSSIPPLKKMLVRLLNRLQSKIPTQR